MKTNRSVFLILFLLFISGILIRFYHLERLFFFNIDEDWFLYIVRKIVVDHKPVLIGWEMPGGLLTIPVMYYLGSLIIFISNNNPLGLAVNAAVISSISVVLTFVVGKKIFHNTRLALIAAFLFCFSYLIIIYTKVSLSIYLGPLLSLLTYFSLTKIINEGKLKWLYVLVVVFIFASQEGSLLSLVLLSVILLIKHKKKLFLPKVVVPAIILCLSITPLVIFDLRHDFLATKRIVNFITFSYRPQGKPLNIDSSIKSLKLLGNSIVRTYFVTGLPDLNYQILPCEKYLADKEVTTPGYYPFLGLFLVLTFFKLTKNRKPKTTGHEILATHFLVVVCGLLLYSLFLPGHQHEWFFVVLMPSYIFFGAYLIDWLIRTRIKLLKLAVVVLLLIFLIHNFKYLFSTSALGYDTKYKVTAFIKNELTKKSFDIDILGDKCNAYGFRYLLTYLETEPNISYMDNQYDDWLYPKKEDLKADYHVYLVPLGDITDQKNNGIYQDLLKIAKTKKIIDSVEVLIVPNNPDVK